MCISTNQLWAAVDTLLDTKVPQHDSMSHANAGKSFAFTPCGLSCLSGGLPFSYRPKPVHVTLIQMNRIFMGATFQAYGCAFVEGTDFWIGLKGSQTENRQLRAPLKKGTPACQHHHTHEFTYNYKLGCLQEVKQGGRHKHCVQEICGDRHEHAAALT